MRVSEIFARLGERDFRARERTMLLQVSQLDEAVVATGGGAVLDPENRATLRSTGTVICLQADVATILLRVGGGDDRPLLAGAVDRVARVNALLAERADAYADADCVIETSGKSVGDIVAEIVGWLDRPAKRPQAAERGE